MKIDFVSIKDSEPNSSSKSDFKDVLKSVKSDKRSVKAIKQISENTKYERKKRKEKILKVFTISPIFDLFFSSDKRNRDNTVVNRLSLNKAKVLSMEDLSLTDDTSQQVTNSINCTFYLKFNDDLSGFGSEKLERNGFGLTNFFVQRANQEKLMLHPNYISTKTSRDYQVYFKGRRYYFNINENDVLSRVEDKDDGS